MRAVSGTDRSQILMIAGWQAGSQECCIARPSMWGLLLPVREKWRCHLALSSLSRPCRTGLIRCALQAR